MLSLRQAVIENNIFEVKLMLLVEENINLRYENSATILMLAIKHGCLDIVNLLLNTEGINLNAKDLNGNSALSYAAFSGNADIFKAVLEKTDEDVNTGDSSGFTPLIWATINGHVDIASQLLLCPKTEINAVDKRNNTALIFAAARNNILMVRFLLGFKDLKINFRGVYKRTALMWAAREGHHNTVKLLLETDTIDVNAKDDFGKTALVHAVGSGCTISLSLLERELSKGVVFSGKFYSACGFAKLNIIKYLMYSGRFIHTPDNSLLGFNNAIRNLEILNKLNIDEPNAIFFERIKFTLLTCLFFPKENRFFNFPKRVNLLEAKICGVGFAKDITETHSGITMPKFLWISSLMRNAKLAKLAYGFNDYIFMHILLLRDNIGSYLDKLPFELKIEVLNFISAKDFSKNIKDLPPVAEVLPASIISPATYSRV